MKKYLLILTLLFLSVPAFATSGKVETIFDAQSVSGTGSTITSRTFNVGSVYRMGFWMKMAKAGSPEGASIKMKLEGSYDETATHFATMSTILEANTFTLTTTPVATAGTIDPVPSMKYVRFVAEGLTGNATGTTVTAYLFTQEQN